MKKQFQSNGTSRMPRVWQLLMTMVFLFTLGIGQMWAETFTMADIFTGSNQSATVTSPVAATVSTNANAGNAAQSKLGSDGNYFQVVLSSGTFTAASINGYINTTSTSKNWGFQFSTDGGTTWATEVTQANDGTKSAHDIAVGVTIPSGANGIRVTRRAGTSTYVYSISLTLASGGGGNTDPVASVTVAGETAGYATVPVALTATPDETATAYKWFVDGVEQSGQTAATFNFTAATPGTYNIVAKARNDYNAENEWIASDAHTFVASKLCGELIKIVQNGQNDGTVSGILTGTKDVKLSSGTSEYDSKTGRKIGSDNYWLGITNLSSTLRAGDVVSVFVTTASANLILYSDKGSTKIGEKIGGVVQGENQIVLNSNATGKSAIYLYRVPTSVDAQGGSNMNPYVHSLAVTRSCAISDDCSIKSLTINSDEITPAEKVYSYVVAAASALTEVEVAYTIHPLASGSPASGFKVAVPAAGDPANTQTITVTAEDGTHSDTYTVSVTKATAASNVVTLDALGVTGYTLDPAFVPATTVYSITKAYGAADPVAELVTYTKTEEAQTVGVVYSELNRNFTITVTAEDNTTKEYYVINILEAEAKRDLLEVMFSNGAKGAINAGTKEIRVPYIGADAPTFVSAAFASWVEAGATAAMNGDKLKVTGADGKFDEYTIVPVQLDVTGVALGEDITFSAVPAYIFAPYGWDSGKGVKFAKNQEQEANRRISSGNSRIYIAVPTGVASLQLTSGSTGARNVVIKVNGETSSITKTAASNSAIELAMNPAIVNFVYIENNTGSGGGDAGFIKMHLVPAYSVTYDAGAGAVKGGETMPTQVAVAAGTEITLASGDALEKDGYDFNGWLCNIDGVTYNAAAAYTMTAAATTFTAQWVEHIVPVDPALIYSNGAYNTAQATALDLSTLIDQNESTGAITYSVKEANGTGAAIDGVNFTATAAGTAVITASQAAVVGFNAKSVDFNVVVSEPTEMDGIKMVEAGALTGNFRVKPGQLKTGAYTVEGINYAKYVQMGSTHTNFSGETEGNQAKGIYYAPTKKNIKFWFYMRNTESSTTRNIYIYTIEEGEAITSQTVAVEAGSHLVSADITLSTNAEIVFGVDNTKLYFCQIVAVESGDALLQGGEAGYVFDYSKKRQNVAANTLRTIDGIDYKLSAESKINSASNVQLTTLGTHYIKFHLDAPKQVNVYADNKKYYIGSECSTEDAAKLYEATGNGEFALAAGDWYINGSGVQVKINKLEFALPKCEKPSVTPMANVELCEGEAIAPLTVTASVSDGGTLHYAWFKEAGETDEAVGTDNASFTPLTDGEYYVIVTNQLADHSDNSETSNTITVKHFASAQITEAPENVYKHTGLNATLSVVAEGKNVSYEWFACDDAEGNNPVAFAPAQTGTSLLLENIEAGVKYYKVLVSSDCGNASAVAKVEGFDDLPQVNVTGATTWDWSLAGSTSLENQTNVVLANVEGINNNADFNSQALLGSFNKLPGNYFQGSMLTFTTEVPGKLTITFRGTNNNARHLQVCVGDGEAVVADWNYQGSGESAQQEKTVFVPAGKVTLKAFEGENANNARIYRMELNTTPDYTRDQMLGAGVLGTLCVKYNVPLAGINGATFYELQGRENTYGKLVFDEIISGELVAGKPYVFQAHGDVFTLFYGATKVDDPVNGNGMYGTFEEIVLTELTDVYYFAQKALWSCDGAVDLKVPANRAYVKLSEMSYLPANNQPAPGRRRITMNVNGEKVATGFEAIEASEKPMKLMINGQIFILRGDKLFDATGRLVK